VKRFEYKVPGGKLLRAKVEVDAGRITFLQLTGDFFMELETRLMGMRAEPVAIKGQVVSFFTAHKTMIAGASPRDFAYVINQAIRA